MRRPDPKRLEQIRILSEQGLSGIAIARQMGLNILTVSKWKKRMGLPTWPALPEAKVLELLQGGMAPRRVAETLRISKRGTIAFAWANNFGKRPRTKLSRAQLAMLKSDIVKREASAAALAKKYKCSYKLVLLLAHSVLACERFLPSWKNPLASYFPSRPPEIKLTKAADAPNPKMAKPNEFVQIIDRIFGDKLPFGKEFDVLVTAAMLTGLMRAVPDFQGQPPAVLHSFALGLVEAITCVRESARQAN